MMLRECMSTGYLLFWIVVVPTSDPKDMFVERVHIANTLRHSLELPTSLIQASLKSNLPRRDLSLTLE
jgi:hypothetical protein